MRRFEFYHLLESPASEIADTGVETLDRLPFRRPVSSRQIASFLDEQKASGLALQLRARGFDSEVESAWANGVLRHRVRIVNIDPGVDKVLKREIREMGLDP